MKVILQPFAHHGAEVAGIIFEYNAVLDLAVRKLKGIRWSQSRNCWYLPLAKESYEQLKKAVREIAAIDDRKLKIYLQKKAAVKETLVTSGTKQNQPVSKSVTWKVAPSNMKELARFIEQLKLKAYSVSTIRTYRSELLQLLQLLKNRPVNEMTPDDLRRYLVYCFEKLGLTESTLHSRMNALKFYFEQVLGRDKFFWELPRPKKAEQLPRFFSQEEVAAILNSITNIKHKTMLMLAYSAGLRVSEVVTIKTKNVDSNRMTILIEKAKGKKDRMVALSPVLLIMLRRYAHQYKPDRNSYLFVGVEQGKPYAVRSLQEVIQAAKARAAVLKPGGVHSLRHSFATHLVDRGTDVTMIQKLLGHTDIKTTLRYLHTSNKDLLKIVSPLDNLPLT